MGSQARPIDIVIAKMDKKCPKCNAGIEKTRISKGGKVYRGDFDIGQEDGVIFGARCPHCLWSF